MPVPWEGWCSTSESIFQNNQIVKDERERARLVLSNLQDHHFNLFNGEENLNEFYEEKFIKNWLSRRIATKSSTISISAEKRA